jgi:hypothetical protein
MDVGTKVFKESGNMLYFFNYSVFDSNMVRNLKNKL